MDIVYIVGPGSLTSNTELRFSLRSIAKYGKNVDRVIVAGTPPEWLSDEVIKCPFEQTAAKKNLRIFETILHVMDTVDFPKGEFLVSMDDHFYTRPVDFDKYPYYNKIFDPSLCSTGGMLPNNDTKYNGNEMYGNILKRSCEWLKSHGYPTFNMTLHRNMHMSVESAKKHRKELDAIVKGNADMEGMCILVDMYLNDHPEVKPIAAFDSKIFRLGDISKIGLDECFSTSTTIIFNGKVLRKMDDIYKEKCKYEK